MFDERYSLCITYCNIRNGRKQFFRIADYDLGKCKMEKAYYSNKYDEVTSMSFDPQIIGGKAYEVGKAEIRKWWPLENDNTKSDSSLFDEMPIEIVFAKELFEWEEQTVNEKVRKIIADGFEINPTVCDKFLYIIARKQDSYIAVQCEKKMFNNRNNVFKIKSSLTELNNSVQSVNIDMLDRDDMVEIDNWSYYDETSSLVEERYFYKWTSYAEPIKSISLHDPKEYVLSYVIKLLKEKKSLYQLSKSEIQKLNLALDGVVKNDIEFEALEKITGIEKEEILKVIGEFQCEISQEIREMCIGDDIVRKWLLNDADIMGKCKEDVEVEWKLAHSEEINLAKCNIENMQATIKELKQKEELFAETIANYKQQEEELIGKVEELTNLKQNLQTNLEKEIEEYRGNIAKQIVWSTLAGNSETKKIRELELYITNTECMDNAEKYERIEDAIGDLQENLQNAFVNEKYVAELSSLLLACYLNRKNLVINENADLIADALSMVVEAQLATKVYVPAGFVDFNIMLNCIEKCAGDVVVIQGLLSRLDDETAVALNKHCKSKVLVFDVQNDCEVNLVSKEMWNEAVFIDMNGTFGLIDQDDNMYGYLDDDLRKYCCLDIKKVKEKMKNLKKIDGIRDMQKYLLAQVLATGEQFNLQEENMFIKRHLCLFSDKDE